MATDQESDAPSSSACPLTAPGACQSIAQGPSMMATPSMARATAPHRMGDIRSFSTSMESGTNHISVTLLSTAVRPAGTSAKARWAKRKKPANCRLPSASTEGISRRAGQRSRRRSKASSVAEITASPAREVANHSGVACIRACLVTGQTPPKSTTASRRSFNPRAWVTPRSA
jgi:hypothetical protein